MGDKPSANELQAVLEKQLKLSRFEALELSCQWLTEAREEIFAATREDRRWAGLLRSSQVD